MSDIETVIKLGAAITAARAELRDAEEMLVRRRMHLQRLEQQLEGYLRKASSASDENADPKSIERARLDDINRRIHAGAASNVDVLTRRVVEYATEKQKELDQARDQLRLVVGVNTDKRPVSVLVAEFFDRHRTGSFTANEVARAIGVSGSGEMAVRQAINRLFHRQRLLKEKEGYYSHNPLAPQKALPNPDSHDSASGPIGDDDDDDDDE